MLQTQQQIRKLTYFNCEKQGHEQQPLSRICIEQKCSSRTLVCALCQNINHQGHQTLPLKTYLINTYCNKNQASSVNNKKKEIIAPSQKDINPIFLISQIDEIKNSFFTVIAEYKNQVLDMLSTMETHGKMFFNRIKQETKFMINLENPISFLQYQKINQKKLKEYFQQMTKTINYKEKQMFSLSNKLEQIVQNCKDKEKKLADVLNKSNSALSKQMMKISLTLDQSLVFSTSQPTFFWSETFKGHKVKISGVVAEQTGMQSSGQRFALVQPAFGTFGGNKKLTWGMKVIKFVGWVGIGICLKSHISKGNYHFNYGNIGHGSYLISTNGYAWSHSVKQFNSAFKSFQFAVNDTVFVQYDPANKKLRFKKAKGNETFALDIVDPPGDDEYCPCANICSNGDTVQIVNEPVEF